MIYSWASKVTIMKMMQCSLRSHWVELHALHVPRTSLICMANKCSTCHGANFHSGTLQRELQELAKVSLKCFQWSILNNCRGTTDSKLIRVVKKTSWRVTRTMRCRLTVRWWWREDCHQMASRRLQVLTNHTEET